jgi:hypothetical protein
MYGEHLRALIGLRSSFAQHRSPYSLYGEHFRAWIGERSSFAGYQSACLRRKAGISISSMPLLANASTFAAAERPLRHTLGVVNAL